MALNAGEKSDRNDVLHETHRPAVDRTGYRSLAGRLIKCWLILRITNDWAEPAFCFLRLGNKGVFTLSISVPPDFTEIRLRERRVTESITLDDEVIIYFI